MSRAPYTIRDVVARTGVNPITLRSWIRHGVVPKASGRARGTRYREEHVLRILAVQELRAKGYSLGQVAHRVWRMTDEQFAQVAARRGDASGSTSATDAGAASAGESTSPRPAPPTYAYRALEWVALMPGLSLIVDPGGGEVLRRVADEIARNYSLQPTAAKLPV